MNENLEQFRLEFAPSWEHLDDVRRFVQAFCVRCQVHEDRADAIGMTVHELLQNAVRDAVDGRTKIAIVIDKAKDEVRVTMENRGAPDQLPRLMAWKNRLESQPDDMALFLGLMKASAGQGGSGLGLGRIRYEGGMRLEISVSGDLVSITASGPLGCPGSAP